MSCTKLDFLISSGVNANFFQQVFQPFSHEFLQAFNYCFSQEFLQNYSCNYSTTLPKKKLKLYTTDGIMQFIQLFSRNLSYSSYNLFLINFSSQTLWIPQNFIEDFKSANQISSWILADVFKGISPENPATNLPGISLAMCSIIVLCNLYGEFYKTSSRIQEFF